MRIARTLITFFAICPLFADTVLKLNSDQFLHNVQNWQLPEYPRRSVSKGDNGVVVVKLRVNPAGHVENVDVLSGPDVHLSETVRLVVSKWQFRPFLENGKAVSAESTIYVQFRLQPMGPNVTIPGLTQGPEATVKDPYRRPNQ